MKKIYLSIILSLFLSLLIKAQSVADAAIPLTASVQVSPPQITITWSTNVTTTAYTIYRKLKVANTWGVAVANLSGTATAYVDNTVVLGESYEYRVARTGTGYGAYGYINAGIQVPAIENRGNLILLVDSTFIVSLDPELKRLEADLEGDGWDVKRLNVLRTGSVTNVKAKILNIYNQDPTNTKALFIFGHVPVPYSGNINPDGHPDHLGAWPTDAYYAELNGAWTDASVSSTPTNPIRIVNVPGDGKFDQSILPSGLELQCGRVDLYNLTSFTLTETQLMKNYLDKDHNYRKKVFSVQNRGIVDSNFGFMLGEAFAASGYNNLSVLVGINNVIDGDYLTAMTGTTSYKWSYGCGGGSFTSAGGIGNTANFATANLQGVFTMLFGSYFGDWDVQNSFLRAPLAQGKMLTNSWSGRPHHQYHWMALGENIGYCMMTTMNYQGPLYYPNYYGITAAWIHNGLMGDPSLRNDVVAPVASVVATKSGNDCVITWAATTETNILGYNIYMKNDTNKTYVKINPSYITGTTYTNNCLLYPGIYKYMVRAVKLENTPSGSYYNMSEGIADTALNNNNLIVDANFNFAVVTNTVTFTNLSANASVYSWTLGNGTSTTSTNPVITYTANGVYTVTLISFNPCDSDTITKIVTITAVGLNEQAISNAAFNFYPNPTNGEITLIVENGLEYKLSIYNYEGKEVFKKSGLNNKQKLNLSGLNKGLYLMKLTDKENNISNKKLIIE